jgi:CSLREA domain-containing protein
MTPRRSTTRPSSPRRQTRARQVLRPVLESLEGRIVLSTTYIVNSLTDTNPPANVMTLRQAILAADADHNTDPAHPDIINFSVSGTIALGSELPAITGSLTVNGPGASALTILGPAGNNPNTQSGVVSLAAASAATLSGLTIDGNNASGDILAAAGSTLDIVDDQLQHGSGTSAGGILALANHTTVSDSSIVENIGGGIYSTGSLSVSSSTIADNSGNFTGGIGVLSTAAGGGVVTITQSTISGNQSDLGAGGGGVYLGDDGAALNATIADSTIVANIAHQGGGVSAVTRSGSPVNLTISSSTIANNVVLTANLYTAGGGLYDNSTPVKLSNTIIAGNGDGDLDANNNVIGFQADDDIIATLDSSSAFDLISIANGSSGVTNGVNHDQLGTLTSPINALLGPLQNNGGPTETILPLAGSPALDQGGADPVLAALGISTDQRGDSRVVRLAAVPTAAGDGRDIGATELTPTILTVNSTADANPPAGVLTLREAIEAADGTIPLSSLPSALVVPGDAGATNIEFNLPASSTIVLASALQPISGVVTIQGPGASDLTIKGNATTSAAILPIAASSLVDVSGLTLNGQGTSSTQGIDVGAGSGLIAQGLTIESVGFGSNGNNPGAAILATQGGSTIVVEDSQLENNQGSGIVAIGVGSLTVERTTISNNASTGPGGGLYVSADANGNGGSFTVLDSLFSNNFANSLGGAIYASTSAPSSIIDSTITGNQAEGVGGGIYVRGSAAGTTPINLTIADSTIVDNSAFQAGGGIDSASTQPFLLVDSIVDGNTAGQENPTPSDVIAVLSSQSSFNLIGVGSGQTGLTPFANGNLIGTASAPIDPELGPLQDNGGPTLTMAPLPSSPVIDAGGPSPTTDALTSTDQRGEPRINDLESHPNPFGGDGRDIGAVEIQGTFAPTILTVNTTADADPPSGTLSLREAIEAADGTIPISSLPAGQVQAGTLEQIIIDLGVTGQIALASALPQISGNVSIQGPGASDLTIKGDGLEADPVFSLATMADAVIDGLTIDANHGSGSEGIAVGAAAILTAQSDLLEGAFAGGDNDPASGGIVAIAVGSTVTVDLSTFDSNFGSGIINLGGALSVDESTFTNNTSTADGGGILDGSLASGFGGYLSVSRSLFENNFANSLGGGIAVLGGGNATISDSTFVGNIGGSLGGGIAVQSIGLGVGFPTTLTLLRSTLTSNVVESGGSGGGLYAISAAVIDSIIAGNTRQIFQAPSVPDDANATFSAGSSNDILGVGSGQTGLTIGLNGVQFGDAANPLDPKLGPLQNNGGPTLSVALLPGSPALDAGSGTIDAGTDQRGVVRGTVIDIGAYQATPSKLLLLAPSPTTAGQAQPVTVDALDSFGQQAYDDRDAIAFTSTDTNAILPASAMLSLGSGTFSATFETAGSQSLTATDATTGLTATQAGILVQAANANHGVAISGTPQAALVTTAFATAPQVEVLDAYGNPLPGVTVTFTIQPSTGGAGANFPGNALTAIAITNSLGIATAPPLTAGAKPGAYALLATANAGTLALATFALANTPAPPITVASTPSISALQGISTGLVTVATFHDPDLALFAAGNYTATINWGDGSGTLTGIVQIVAGQLAVEGMHTYLTAGTFHTAVTLIHAPTGRHATATATVKAAPDISSNLSVRRGGLLYNFRTGLYTAQLTITNNGSSTVYGPIDLVVAGLPSSITVANASGSTGLGQSTLLLNPPTPLAPGQSTVVTISFRDPGQLFFDYTLTAYELS